MKNFLCSTLACLLAFYSFTLHLSANSSFEVAPPVNATCITFTNGMDGFVPNQFTLASTSTLIPLNGSGQYLRGDDLDGSSFISNTTNPAFSGDLSCSIISFDLNVENDGWAGTINTSPSITIFSGGTDPTNATLSATFVVSTTATETMGWMPYTVSLNNNNTLPPGWVMTNGNNNQWQALVMNVTGIAFTTDVAVDDPTTQGPNESATSGEFIGIDNICICPSSNAGVAAFQLEDVNGNVQTTFCEGETIMFNGTASMFESRYYIDVWKRPAGSNQAFTWLADQNVTGWVQGQVGSFDFTNLFLNDPDGSIVFGPECEYQIQLAIDNPSLCIPWTSMLSTFTIDGLPVPEFHFEDADGNIQDVFCEGEEIILNGTASLYESRHFIAVTEIAPDGTSEYLFHTGNIWEPADITSLSHLMEDNDDFFKAGYTYEIKLALGNNCLNWIEVSQSFTIESLNSPWFPRPEFCRQGDNVEVTVTASNEHNIHAWLVFLGDVDGDCVSNPLPGPIDINSGNQGTNMTWTFTIPYVSGQCIVINHGTWSDVCDWWEFRRAVEIPEIPLSHVNFTYTFSQLTDIWYNYNYQAMSNSFPVVHEWAIEESLEPDGPWNTPNFSGDLDTDSPWAFQSLERYYRITHWVRSNTEEFCSENRMRITIHPQGEDGRLVVTDDRGNHIDTIDPRLTTEDDDREDDDETGDGRFSGIPPGQLGSAPSDKTQLNLYPNPASQQVSLRINATDFQAGFTLQMTSISGQVVFTKTFGQDTFTTNIETNHLPNGLYQLRLFTESGEQIVRKLVVQH